MRIAILIPDRKDRSRFLENCHRQMWAQTVKPTIILTVNDEPESSSCDITWRYRKGYDALRNQNLDAILFIENDDWYAPDYIEIMLKEWEKAGRPELFGTTYTIYYHIKLFAYFTMHHHSRSSAMSTLIKPDMDFPWPVDHEPYTDVWLWEKLKGVLFTPEKHICMGMKHGEGFCGGRSHVDQLDRYTTNKGITDYDKIFLRGVLDPKGFDFFANYFNGK